MSVIMIQLPHFDFTNSLLDSSSDIILSQKIEEKQSIIVYSKCILEMIKN